MLSPPAATEAPSEYGRMPAATLDLSRLGRQNISGVATLTLSVDIQSDPTRSDRVANPTHSEMGLL
ncbi:hypothetical protein PIB30_080108, partial [Stylosanthes scabra]|nr:hypothetical protein [Stylosanthes scabra]